MVVVAHEHAPPDQAEDPARGKEHVGHCAAAAEQQLHVSMICRSTTENATDMRSGV